MKQMGLLVDYEWCTGCHSCEFACQMEHGFPVGQTGIKLSEIGPWRVSGDTWQYAFLPTPTIQCDQCAERQGLGKQPTCVQHCQAKCLYYGPLEEIQERLAEKPRQCLYALGAFF